MKTAKYIFLTFLLIIAFLFGYEQAEHKYKNLADYKIKLLNEWWGEFYQNKEILIKNAKQMDNSDYYTYENLKLSCLEYLEVR